MRTPISKRYVEAALRAQRVLWPCLLSLPAWAQDAGSAPRSWYLQPTFTSRISLLDTHRPAAGNTSDEVLELQPGLRASASTGRVRGSLQYALSAVLRAKGSPRSEFANSLNSQGSAEIVPQWMYVEGTATVTQQALNAYGQQSVNLATTNPNRGEVANVTISPFVRGLMGPAVRYEARLTAAGTNTRRSKVGDSRGESALFSLNSATETLLGWGLVGTSDRSHYRLGRDTQVDRMLASASWRPDPELGFTARGGRERSDVLSLDPKTYDNWGAGLRWTPSARTVVSGDFDRRYFGDAYNVSMTHRMPLSSFSLSSSRSAITGGNIGGQSTTLTLAQLYDLLLTSRYPDAAQRALIVAQLVGSRDPNTLVQGGFVNQGIQLTRRDELAWTYGLQRLSLNLIASRAATSTLSATDTSAQSAQTRQRSLRGLVSYQLTPTSSLTLDGSLLQTPSAQTTPGTSLKSLSIGWNGALGRYASVLANARYSTFDSPTDPYREAALTASLSLRF